MGVPRGVAESMMIEGMKKIHSGGQEVVESLHDAFVGSALGEISGANHNAHQAESN